MYYGRDYIEIGLADDLRQKADKSKSYTKNEINALMKAKQNTLTLIDPMNLGTRVASYLLLVGSNIIPGLYVKLPLTLNND